MKNEKIRPLRGTLDYLTLDNALQITGRSLDVSIKYGSHTLTSNKTAQANVLPEYPHSIVGSWAAQRRWELYWTSWNKQESIRNWKSVRLHRQDILAQTRHSNWQTANSSVNDRCHQWYTNQTRWMCKSLNHSSAWATFIDGWFPT